MSTILFLSPRFPWPLVGGDRVKTYHLLQHLARAHRVILVTFNHGKLPSAEQLHAIESLGVDVRPVSLDPFWAGLASVRTLWTGLPLEIAFYTRPAFQQMVNKVLKSEHVDTVISFFMRTAEYVRHNHNLRKVLVAEDCRVVYQRRSTEAVHSPLQRLVRWWETRKLMSYERNVVNDFDVTTLVSEHDVLGMRQGNAQARYAVVTNGVDLERFEFRTDQEQRTGLLFAGKLDVQANHLMALAIVGSIYPQIVRQRPDAKLEIVGARPLAELLRQLPADVTLHRDVPDMVPYLHKAAVFLHPHRGGSGIQNKILEAMSAGCAVVTSPSGLQGIRATHGVHCLVGHTDAELAQHAVTLLRDTDLRLRLAQAARELMQTDHHWLRIGHQLDVVLMGTHNVTTGHPHESAVP